MTVFWASFFGSICGAYFFLLTLKWIFPNKKQPNMCAFCGFECTTNEGIMAHISQCDKHPLAEKNRSNS